MAKNRKEAFLAAIAGEDVGELKPKNRQEAALDKIAKGGSGGGGGDTIVTLTFPMFSKTSIGEETYGEYDKSWDEVVAELGADPDNDEVARTKFLKSLRIIENGKQVIPVELAYSNSLISFVLVTNRGTSYDGYNLNMWRGYFYKSGDQPSVLYYGSVKLTAPIPA